MNRSAKRVAIVALIIAASILLGFAVDLIWTKLEQSSHPDRYMEYVSKYAYEYNVPEPVILAVIKVESGFNPRAVSYDKDGEIIAMGLMQMVPKTFEWLCSDEHLDERLHEDDLFEPEISIKYGTYYLSYLHKKFDRNWDTALAAYNGGEGNVAKWLKNPEYSDGNGNLTYIPFKETRNYVQKVNKAIDTYKNLYYQNQKEVVENEN